MPYIYAIIAVLLIAILVIAVRTYLFTRSASQPPLPCADCLPDPQLDPLVAARHLSAAIQVQTVSHEDHSEDKPENFATLRGIFEDAYPLLHKQLTREVFEGGALLYTWRGRDESLYPVLFMAHQDVVPADEHTLDQWTYPPFSGAIEEGFVWGRGSMDIKSQLVGIMEAVEHLLAAGFTPERTVYIASAPDEEVLGLGAPLIVSRLKERGVRLQAVIDEGTAVLDGVLPGFKGTTAPIAVSEKGFLSIRLTVESGGGHSSMPSRETAIGILSRAIDRLQSKPFPYNLKASLPMFRAFSPAASPLMKVAFANLWLFGGLVRDRLAASPETAASIRTTTAPTIFRSGIKENVLPSLAEAVVNFRILPGESIVSVVEHVRRVIADERVKVTPIPTSQWEPSPVSPTASPAYRHITSVVKELYPGTTCAPNIMLGATDSRHFHAVSDRVYRFSPILSHAGDLKRVHGINERLSIDNLNNMVLFFFRLIQRWSSKDM
jgi:carboxypeptidase PM20D1